MKPKISCIVLNYNTAEMTIKAIESFLTSSQNIEAEVILIDNGSKEPLTSFPDNHVQIIQNNENVGFAKAVNQGLQLSQGDYILLLNSDVLIDKEALEGMIEYAETQSKIGIIGPMMAFPNKSFQPSSGYFPTVLREIFRFSKLGKSISGGTLLYKNKFNKSIFSKPILVDWVSGGCMLIKKQVLEKIGLFDDRYFFSIEDIDYCYRAKELKFSVAYLPTVSVVHYHSYSAGGHASLFTLKQEKISMNLFLQSHYKSKIMLRLVYNFLSQSKIFIFEKVLKRT